MALTADSKLAEILDNAEGAKVLAKYLPNLSSSPMLGMARGMSLQTISGFPQANISADTLKSIVAELAQI